MVGELLVSSGDGGLGWWWRFGGREARDAGAACNWALAEMGPWGMAQAMGAHGVPQ